ncbi:MAG: TrkA C-terminal domain-containing protein [Deferrisomatales bacterium]
MERATCVVVGAGRVGRELVGRLSRDLQLVCIDRDPQALAEVGTLRAGKVRLVEGDAASRLVLEDAGVAQAQVVALTITSERVNLEVGRVLRDHFDVPRIVAIGITTAGIEEFRSLGIEAEGVLELGANALRNRIEARARTAHGIGLGQDEIIEAEVHARSRLAGKPLRALNPRRWHVGLVYRNGSILVPQGDTVLRGGDRVVLTGEPGVLRTVVEMLTLSFQRFPLEYGTGLTAYLTGGEDERFFEELAYLQHTFPVTGVHLLLSPGACRARERLETRWERAGLGEWVDVVEISGSPLEGLTRFAAADERRHGLVAVCRRCLLGPSPSFSTDGHRKRFLQGAAEGIVSPVLLAAGTFPYERIGIPAVPGVDVEHALEAVFEMAPALHPQAAVLLARPSPHMAPPRGIPDPEAVRALIADLGLAYRIRVDVEEIGGNPVRAAVEALRGRNLAVVDTGGWKRPGFLRALLSPDVPWLVVRRCPVSALILPPDEEAL